MNSSAFVFNPLFDTVIQRNNYNYLRYHNRELDDKTIDKLFVRCYTGILRWQMLTVGSVVLTDAMWYDSIFFRKLVVYSTRVGFFRKYPFSLLNIQNCVIRYR